MPSVPISEWRGLQIAATSCHVSSAMCEGASFGSDSTSPRSLVRGACKPLLRVRMLLEERVQRAFTVMGVS
jgi:hypothetical protein